MLYNTRMVVLPTLTISPIVFILNIVLNYVYIYLFNWGFIGSALATTTSRTLMLILMVLFIYYKKLEHKTWHGWSKEAIKPARLTLYMRYGIPAGLTLMFEIWGFEMNTFIVAKLNSSVILSAYSIAYSITTIFFMVSLALSIGTCTRVGHLLGEGDPARARLAGYCGIGMAIVTLGLMTVITFAIHDVFGKVYTSQSNVLELASKLMFFSGTVAFLDGVQN